MRFTGTRYQNLLKLANWRINFTLFLWHGRGWTKNQELIALVPKQKTIFLVHHVYMKVKSNLDKGRIVFLFWCLGNKISIQHFSKTWKKIRKNLKNATIFIYFCMNPGLLAHSKNENLYFIAPTQTKRMQPIC